MQVQGKSLETYKDGMRIDAWLWLRLRQEGFHIPVELFGDRDFRARLEQFVAVDKIQSMINSSKQNLLPTNRFEWITESERQIRWLSEQNELRLNIYPLPVWLYGRDLVIASFDALLIDLNAKTAIVERLRGGWNEHVKRDSIFAWFKGEEEVSRCALAWDWLVEKRAFATIGIERIQSHDALLAFFDRLLVDPAQKQLDVNAIKRRWAQQKYRQGMKGKKQYNFVLSDQTISQLDKLAMKYGVSRPQIIEALVQFEIKNSLYLPGKINANPFG